MDVIDLGSCVLEPWSERHIPGAVAVANDPRVSAGLTDRFPFPYTLDDARTWVDTCAGQRPPTHFAIVVDGVVAGGVGFDPFVGEESGGAEMGYWLGHEYWGRGLATTGAKAITSYAFAATDLRRLQAVVFSWNLASVRVLEKAGYRLEGRHREAIVKRGRIGDRLVYARLRTDPAPSES